MIKRPNYFYEKNPSNIRDTKITRYADVIVTVAMFPYPKDLAICVLQNMQANEKLTS